MAELTAEEYFPNDTYHKQWSLFWILAVASAVLIWLSFFRPMPMTESPRAAISAGYDWFLVLHMPEIPKDPLKAAALQKSYAGWLEALARERYHPMLLSDIEQRVERREGLPERAVVLVFDPAYNHTYETLSPLFVQYRFPALWVTDHTAVLRGDRHYIHRHQAQWMVRSGFWDLAYSGDGFWRKASDTNRLILNDSRSASWVPGTGHTALNWGTSLPQLNRLNVSPKWTADELIARLEMELPLQGTVRLGIKRVQNSLWGVVVTAPQKSSLFTFKASLSSSSSNLYWLGTRGVSNVQLDVNIPSFFGEASFWLRSDYKTGQGIGIGFTHHSIFVDQRIERLQRRLFEGPWSPPGGAITGRILLSGNQLDIQMRGAKPLTIVLASEAPSHAGLVRLQVFDRVRGAARVDDVRLSLTSLTPPAP